MSEWQDSQLLSWLSADEYEQIASESDAQKQFREELNDKPSVDTIFPDRVQY